MDRKEANLAFQHLERLKSNLFLVSAAWDRLATLRAERLEGGKEVSRGVVEALKTELNIARRYIEPQEIDAIERELFKAEGEVETQEHAKARERLAQTFSRVTTASTKYIGVLLEEGLI
ncbi:MAG: hypothetical protein ACUVTR_04970 [Dehalococcoidia bacterium]